MALDLIGPEQVAVAKDTQPAALGPLASGLLKEPSALPERAA